MSKIGYFFQNFFSAVRVRIDNSAIRLRRTAANALIGSRPPRRITVSAPGRPSVVDSAHGSYPENIIAFTVTTRRERYDRRRAIQTRRR